MARFWTNFSKISQKSQFLRFDLDVYLGQPLWSCTYLQTVLLLSNKSFGVGSAEGSTNDSLNFLG